MAGQDGVSGVQAAAGATMAAVGGVAGAEVYVRRRAARRLGPGFVSDTRSLLSPAARAAFDKAAANLDAGHAGNIKSYSGYDYAPLNRFSRTGDVTKIDKATGKLVPVTDATEKAALAQRYSSSVAKASEGIAASTLPEGTKVYRAIGTRKVGELKPGASFTDNAIQSTTTKLSEADHFYRHAEKGGRKPIMMVIDAGGKKGLNIASLSEFANEAEVALPAGTTYQVERVEKGVRGSLFEKPRDYVFASVKAQDTGVAAVAEAAQSSRFSRALGTAGKITKGGFKALMPIFAGAAAVSAFSKTGSAAEAGKAAGDVITSGAVSFYDQAKSSGMSDARASAEAVVRGVYNAATFGVFEDKLTVPGSQKARSEAVRNRLARFSPPDSFAPAQASLRQVPQGKAYLNDAAQKKAEASPPPSSGLRTAGSLPPRTDGETDAYTRVDKRTGKTVQVKAYATPKK